MERGTAAPLEARWRQGTIDLRTLGAREFHDITAEVEAFVAASGLVSGMVLLQSLHTTASLLLNEAETGFRADFADVADRLVPREAEYRHDDMSVRWENICPEDAVAPNGHSHLQHTLFGSPSLVLGVGPAGLTLGRWQRVFLIEYDRERDRTVAMCAMGFAQAEAEAETDFAIDSSENGAASLTAQGSGRED